MAYGIEGENLATSGWGISLQLIKKWKQLILDKAWCRDDVNKLMTHAKCCKLLQCRTVR